MSDVRIQLTFPSGDSMEGELTSEEVLDALDSMDPEEWQFGSGDAGVERYTSDGCERLVIIHHPSYGFLLQFWPMTREDETLSEGSKDYDTQVEVYVGGTHWTVPRAVFVSEDVM